jgi:hypothetical protein
VDRAVALKAQRFSRIEHGLGLKFPWGFIEDFDARPEGRAYH